MRISLLLQREPFGSILEQTVARFWSLQYGRAYSASWHGGSPVRPLPDSVGKQLWLANNYLNAVFAQDADPSVFYPIQREFSRSLIWWKQPLQSAYVKIATSNKGAPLLAHACLLVKPAVPRARQKVIVAGNHKIRVLNRRAGLAYVILKQGFLPKFIQRELKGRLRAAGLGLSVPQLVSVADDGTWFGERYIEGTPFNRLTDSNLLAEVACQASAELDRLHSDTVARQSSTDYLRRQSEAIKALITSNQLLSPSHKGSLLAQSTALQERAGRLTDSSGQTITTAFGHGDFQPANIVVGDNEHWLIDWEYAGRRQIAYDYLVFALSARFASGLAQRLSAFVRRGWPTDTPLRVPRLLEKEVASREWRLCLANLFLLEELHLQLEENSQRSFVRLGTSLYKLQAEISHWLENYPA